MFLKMIYDEKLAQAAYLIGCQRSGEAVVIDPQRDVDRYLDLARKNDLRIVATAETHIHADFVSGSRELAEQVGARVYVSDEGGPDWKYEWLDKKIGGGSYDHQLLRDGDTFSIGNIEIEAIHTPGHTPEHIVFLVTDRGGGADEPIGVATGDFVFVGDLGRPDLLETAAGQKGAMESSARLLYQTLEKFKELPDYLQVWPAHGAGSACGKALGAVPQSTVGYERRFNPSIRAASSQQNFVDFILSGQPEPPLYFANMKRDNKAGPPVLGSLPRPPKMDLAAFTALDPHAVVILDTRPWSEFRDGHLAFSLSFPVGRTFNTDAGSMIKDTDDIYLVVDESQREEVVRDLIRIGLDRVQGWLDPRDLPASGLSIIPEVGEERAAELVERGEVQVLDVRRATEFAGGHLPGAINIAHTRLASRLSELPRDQRLLVNCRTGRRSARASAFLQRAGFEVVNQAGGIEAWNRLQPSPSGVSS